MEIVTLKLTSLGARENLCVFGQFFSTRNLQATPKKISKVSVPATPKKIFKASARQMLAHAGLAGCAEQLETEHGQKTFLQGLIGHCWLPQKISLVKLAATWDEFFFVTIDWSSIGR